MSKIGSYEYPDTGFSTLLKAIEVLIEKFGGAVNDEKTYAIALGHTTNQSGGFTRKLADLRKYGLIESRGIVATERAKHIVKPLRAEERNDEINKAVMSIKLWEAIYQRIGSNVSSLEDFRIHLAEVTKHRDKAIEQGEGIRNLYKDALSFVTANGVKEANKNSENVVNDSVIAAPPAKPKEEKVPETLIVLKSGDIEITLPRTDSNIEILKSVLIGMKDKTE